MPASAESSTTNTDYNAGLARVGSIMQRVAEAGSDTKRVISPDPYALRGPYRELILNGLHAIASGKFGDDYHGISTSLVSEFLEAEAADQTVN